MVFALLTYELSRRQLQRVMPSHLFEQYDKLMMKKMLEGMEDFRFCHNPHCGSGALGDPSAPIMTCEACLWKSCFVCNTSVRASAAAALGMI
jgi:hypothetical protein